MDGHAVYLDQSGRSIMPRRRYELTDEQHECIEPLLPEGEGRGCPYKDHRQVINGIFWILHSGGSLAGYV